LKKILEWRVVGGRRMTVKDEGGRESGVKWWATKKHLTVCGGKMANKKGEGGDRRRVSVKHGRKRGRQPA